AGQRRAGVAAADPRDVEGQRQGRAGPRRATVGVGTDVAAVELLVDKVGAFGLSRTYDALRYDGGASVGRGSRGAGCLAHRFRRSRVCCLRLRYGLAAVVAA